MSLLNSLRLGGRYVFENKFRSNLTILSPCNYDAKKEKQKEKSFYAINNLGEKFQIFPLHIQLF